METATTTITKNPNQSQVHGLGRITLKAINVHNYAGYLNYSVKIDTCEDVMYVDVHRRHLVKDVYKRDFTNATTLQAESSDFDDILCAIQDAQEVAKKIKEAEEHEANLKRGKELGLTPERTELVLQAHVLHRLENEEKYTNEIKKLNKENLALKNEVKAMKSGYKSYAKMILSKKREAKQEKLLQLKELLDEMKKEKVEGKKFIFIQKNWSIRQKGWKSPKPSTYGFSVEKTRHATIFELKNLSLKFAEKIMNLTK